MVHIYLIVFDLKLISFPGIFMGNIDRNIIKPENWFINLEIHVLLILNMFEAISKGMLN